MSRQSGVPARSHFPDIRPAWRWRADERPGPGQTSLPPTVAGYTLRVSGRHQLALYSRSIAIDTQRKQPVARTPQ